MNIMLNNELKAKIVLILLSCLIILIPSVVISIGLYYFIGHFFATLLISSGLVFIIGQISNIMAQKAAELNVIKLKTNLAEIASAQSMEVSCSYCKSRNIVPIKLSQRNIFNCKDCKQANLIIFQFATAQISTPLELPQLGTPIPIPPVQSNEQQH